MFLLFEKLFPVVYSEPSQTSKMVLLRKKMTVFGRQRFSQKIPSSVFDWFMKKPFRSNFKNISENLAILLLRRTCLFPIDKKNIFQNLKMFSKTLRVFVVKL